MAKDVSKFSRRDFIKAGAATAGIAGILGSCRAPAVKTSRPLNFIFLSSDQQRADALGSSSRGRVLTPNLDRFAAEGVQFSRCYSANPVCVPSRMSTFSGLYTHQHGTMLNDWDHFLPSAEDTLLGEFLSRDYKICWMGKNHTYQEDILKGLDNYWHGGREQSRAAYPHDCTPWWAQPISGTVEESQAYTVTQGAIDFMNANTGSPFFINLNYFDPHPPYQCPQEFAALYDKEEIRLMPHVDVPEEQLDPRFLSWRQAFGTGEVSLVTLRETLKYYYGAVSFVDSQVGRLLTELERLGLVENTVVVYMSDHGDMMSEMHQVRKAMLLYDGLLRVPLIVRTPKGAAGRVEDAPVSLLDLFPTVVEMFGGQPSERLVGQSLKGALDGSRALDPNRHICASAAYGATDMSEPIDQVRKRWPDYETEPDWRVRQAEILMLDTAKTFMVRTPEFKYIMNTGPDETDELYSQCEGCGDFSNLIDDPAYGAQLESLRKEAQKLAALS